MSTSSSDAAETTPLDQSGTSSSAVIHDRVVDIANQSRDRTEFLKLLGADLRTRFGVAIVAIQASHWPSPIMLVTDDLLSQQIDRDVLRELLATATIMPIACDVPIVNSTDGDSTRGLRVELIGVPERASVLLIYANRECPSVTTQVNNLKQLAIYAESSHIVAQQLPIDGDTDLLPSETGLTQPAANEVLRNRDSLRLFHLDLDLNATSYRIANESRRLLGCDRTTLLVPISGRYRVTAVSGVSVFDRRCNSVRAIEQLTQSALVLSRPLVFPSMEPLPPQIQEPLDRYLDESGVMTAVVLPLHAPDHDETAEGLELADFDPFNGHGKIVGVMVLEYFAGRAPLSVGPEMRLVASEATLSLRNSLEHKQVFGLGIWKSIGGFVQSSRMPWAIAAALIATALLIVSMLYQVEHHVIATGSLEPTARREIFATVDGIVKKLHVNDGQTVKEGEVLLELENADLENQAESLAGQIQTASQRLASIQAIRLSNMTDESQSSRMALEERQSQSELANLRAQQTIVQAQQKELLIKSPIDGEVIGWQLHRRLTDRPVSRGNLLISVADHDGPWSLRLNISDRDAGPVLASVQSKRELAVQFAVATQPEASFSATLQSVATAVRMNEAGQHVIDATAKVVIGVSNDPNPDELDEFDPSDMRVGADVTARIACGKRSVLRSWFSDVFDFVHRNLLFYF